MSIVDNTRPPYVVFEKREVEDRAASIEKGHYVPKEIDIAVITRPGSRDSIEKEAKVWLQELRERARKNEVPQVWYDGFTAAYKSWCEGEELPVKGTPIKGWPVLSPVAQKDLIAAGIRTVEDLAQLPDSEVQSVGTGAIAYKQKAQAWLSAANDTGKVTEQLVALAQQVKELTDLTRAQAKELAEYKSRAAEAKPNVLETLKKA